MHATNAAAAIDRESYDHAIRDADDLATRLAEWGHADLARYTREIEGFIKMRRDARFPNGRRA